MARIEKTVYTITDDTTGEEGAETRTFVLFGQVYSIDLTDENYRTMSAILSIFEPYSDKVRRADYIAERIAQGYADFTETMPEHRARNAQIIVRVHSILPRTRTIMEACGLVGKETGLSAVRIRQIMTKNTLAEAEHYLSTHP